MIPAIGLFGKVGGKVGGDPWGVVIGGARPEGAAAYSAPKLGAGWSGAFHSLGSK